jgi:hypothetical protein
MPSHASLTEEQLASVVAFERVRFDGANEEETLVECGLVEAEGGEAPEGGEEGEETPAGDETDAEAPSG